MRHAILCTALLCLLFYEVLSKGSFAIKKSVKINAIHQGSRKINKRHIGHQKKPFGVDTTTRTGSKDVLSREVVKSLLSLTHKIKSKIDAFLKRIFHKRYIGIANSQKISRL
jgi:hypothetical protein